jgi:hypothetical protein
LAALSLDALDHPQYARLEAAAGVSGEDPRKSAVGGVAPGSTIKSDAFSSYKKLEDLFKVEQIKLTKNNPENLKSINLLILEDCLGSASRHNINRLMDNRQRYG